MGTPDPYDMVIAGGIRYRAEDAKALGVTADVDPAVAALEAALAAQEAERVVAEQAETDRLAEAQKTADDAAQAAAAAAASDAATGEQAAADEATAATARAAEEKAAGETPTKGRTPANKSRTAATKEG